MPPIDETSLIRRTYQDKFGASISPAFTSYLSQGLERAQAVLGFRRASEGPLFLEAYLDRPIQIEVEQAFGRLIARDAIVELGNFAAQNAMAMVELWGAAANDLGERNEVAVATLTAPLRHAFSRIGIPIAILASAEPHRLGEASREWGHYYEADPRVCAGMIAQGQQAIGAFLARRAAGRQPEMLLGRLRAYGKADPERIALDSAIEPPITYRMLAERVAESVAHFRANLASDTPVALQLDHGTIASVMELALLEAGIPILSLPLFFSAAQAEHATSACGVQVLPFSAPRTEVLRKSASSPIPEGTARITFTSGSTGAPKGVCLSAQHMLAVAESVIDAIGARHAGRHLALLPPGILLETVAGFFATMLAGGTYVCPPQGTVGLEHPFRPDFARMLRAILDLRITSLILVPEYLDGVVAAMERTGVRLPLLTVVAVGGAHTSPDLIARARALGLPVRQGYGLTECGSVVSIEDDHAGPPGSVGRPLRHLRARLAEDGEVIIEGPMCLGTIGATRAPGPLATGDIGRLDQEGRLWIEGRKSNVIVTSYGRNVAPEWIEAALVAQPDIAQALVYGDGKPVPEALLVPARPDSDLAAAVAAANAGLPEYARIDRWREAAHFTPANGRLTGNGRLRRKEIAAAYLDPAPNFFTELEAASVRERLAFLSVPQLQAGLGGTITRSAYIDYLTQAYHHVSHTVPLMRAARERVGDRPDLLEALDEYIAEEEGHEEWILSDIAACGGDADAARQSEPAPATQAMVDHAYRTIREGNPVAFFGMVYVLESVSVALAQHGASAVAKNLGLPPEAFTYLTSHGALDQHHMEFFAELVNGLADQGDRDAVTQMAKDMFELFGNVFASIELEREHASA